MRKPFFPLKISILAVLVSLAFIYGTVSGVDLIYRDKKGHYHYSCDTMSGDIMIIVKRDMLVINGGPRSGIQYLPEHFLGKDFPSDLREMRGDVIVALANHAAAYGCMER